MRDQRERESIRSTMLGFAVVSVTTAYQKLGEELYDPADVRRGRPPAEFVMNCIRWAHEANCRSNLANQLAQALLRLDPDFQVVIPKPAKDTTIDDFIENLNDHQEAWARQYARKYNNTGRSGGYTDSRPKSNRFERDRSRFDDLPVRPTSDRQQQQRRYKPAREEDTIPRRRRQYQGRAPAAPFDRSRKSDSAKPGELDGERALRW